SARRARVGDHGAVPAARTAWVRGHDVAEQAADGTLHLTGSVADVARDRRGARLAARALAGLAQHRGVHLDVALRAEDDLVEIDFDAKECVLAALGPGPWPLTAGGRAEEALEQVAEPEGRAAPAERVGCAEVVLLPLVRVAEHVVRVGHELEPLGRFRARVHVGVELPRETPVRLLDVLR